MSDHLPMTRRSLFRALIGAPAAAAAAPQLAVKGPPLSLPAMQAALADYAAMRAHPLRVVVPPDWIAWRGWKASQ
jgi:hypothetical protein